MAIDDNGDSVHQFLMECHKISTEAQFTVDSLPNAETPAVERVTYQLDAIRDILLGLNDPHLSGDTLEEGLHNLCDKSSKPTGEFYFPSPTACTSTYSPGEYVLAGKVAVYGTFYHRWVCRCFSGCVGYKSPATSVGLRACAATEVAQRIPGEGEKRQSRDKPTHHQVMIAVCALLHGAAPRHRTDRRLQDWGAVILRVFHGWVISRVFHYHVTWACSGPFRVLADCVISMILEDISFQ
ncbi:hypothetical protein FB451DRAFT_1190078 [Mycena latifolia]|nr:hypothetical protein FB451DRAFT_1190078 [Mycena latifolia]